MIKIAVFIIPKKKIKNKILNLKKIVRKNFGNQPYLSHFPHCTLFTMNVSKNILKNKNKIKKIWIKKNLKNILSINKTGLFLNDPITQGQTIFFKIKKNSFLKMLQPILLKSFSKFRDRNSKAKFRFLWMKKNYIKYGYPFVGINWKPHLTIASLTNLCKKNKFVKNFLKQKINSKEFINKVYVYKINKDKHTYLWNINLN